MVAKKFDVIIGTKLVETGLITASQLKEGIDYQFSHNLDLKSALRELGFVSDKTIAKFFSETYKIAFVSLARYRIDTKVLKYIPQEVATRFKVIPLFEIMNTLTIAISDPLDFWKIESISLKTGKKVKIVIAPESEIIEAIERYYTDEITGLIKTVSEVKYLRTSTDERVEIIEEKKEGVIDLEEIKKTAEDAPVVQLVNLIILRALTKRASDVHIDPTENSVFVRYRIDGILYEITTLPYSVLNAIISRVKIMSNMNIAERRIPQDGGFKVRYQNRTIDFRTATIPTINGEKVAIRILDRERINLKLDSLGFEQEDITLLKKCISRPHGIILVTGPTGSGKTTTLYSFLNKINDISVNIMTLEDPVEYHIRGINQTNINPKQGLTFSNGLRSLLRHDPDVILIGEIRDLETARTSIQSALTGHILFSTLHTNSAVETLNRLIDMGVEPYLLAPSLIAIVAQRLIRKICSSCKTEFKINIDVLKELGLDKELSDFELFTGKGCSRCDYTGYYGQTIIYEILIASDKIKEAICKNATAMDIARIAIEEGMRTLQDSALSKVKQGVTTIEEMLSTVV